MKLKKILIFFAFIFLLNTQSHAFENKIILKINNEIITSVDVFNEIKYLSILIKDFNKFEKKKIYEISINSLIRQKVKEIELRKNYKKLIIEDKYLDPQITNFMKKLEFNSDNEFQKYLREKSININEIKKRLSHEFLWNRLIYKKFNKNIKIDEERIKKNLKENTTQNEYLLSEILFNVENKKNLNEEFEKIKSNIVKLGFSKAAVISSVSSSVDNEGVIGWVKETSISPKLKFEIEKIKQGEFTNPIQIPGGFLILFVNDVRKVKKIINFDEEIKLEIRKETNKQLNQFSNIYFNKIKKNTKINEI